MSQTSLRTFWMALGHVFVSLGCIKFTLILVLLAWKWFVQEDYSVTQTVISNKKGPETAAIKIENLLPLPSIFFLEEGMTRKVVNRSKKPSSSLQKKKKKTHTDFKALI